MGEMIYKDCDNKIIDLGDKVAFIGSHLSELYIGKVVGFTPKKIRICGKKSRDCVKYGIQIAVIEKST